MPQSLKLVGNCAESPRILHLRAGWQNDFVHCEHQFLVALAYSLSKPINMVKLKRLKANVGSFQNKRHWFHPRSGPQNPSANSPMTCGEDYFLLLLLSIFSIYRYSEPYDDAKQARNQSIKGLG